MAMTTTTPFPQRYYRNARGKVIHKDFGIRSLFAPGIRGDVFLVLALQYLILLYVSERRWR